MGGSHLCTSVYDILLYKAVWLSLAVLCRVYITTHLVTYRKAYTMFQYVYMALNLNGQVRASETNVVFSMFAFEWLV